MAVLKKGFSGPVRCEWAVEDNRVVKLLEELCFVDSEGNLWWAPKGSVVDGASIPKILWRLIGSPFVGFYRRASVIHDVYCVTKERPWQQVHKVFHEMMLADGVPKFKAYVMYLAVRFGGPRW